MMVEDLSRISVAFACGLVVIKTSCSDRKIAKKLREHLTAKFLITFKFIAHFINY